MSRRRQHAVPHLHSCTSRQPKRSGGFATNIAFGDPAGIAKRITKVLSTFPDLVSLLLPHPTFLDVTGVHRNADERQLTVAVTSVQTSITCPICAGSAVRMHSRYHRTLADLPWADYTVRFQLIVRRWFCLATTCPRRIFTERLPALVAPWARRTRRLAERQRQLGLTLGGRAGTRLAMHLDQPTSRSTLLRFVRRTPEHVRPTPKHLGVDDFAFRTGQTYGTILVDLDDGTPIDLLPDRSVETLAQWLRHHPGVELISRDRAGAYAEGAAQGAPDAVQVADRWHLLKNLSEALTRLFAEHPVALEPDLGCTNPDDGRTVTPMQDATRSTKAAQLRQQRQDRRQARYAQVQALLHEGVSLRAIAQKLHLSRGTVRTYARAVTPPLSSPRPSRASLLDPYKSYLLERWNDGCHQGTQLLREIQAQGYVGGRSIVLDFIAAIRRQQGVPAMKRTGLSRQAAHDPGLRSPAPRELTWLVLQCPERLDEAEQRCLIELRQANPTFDRAVTLAQAFTTMVRQRQNEALENWLEATEASNFATLRSFAGGIRRDYAAVKAALSMSYSNGVVEGNINRLKYLKRQMYGRANFDLLRKRVLYAP